MSSNKFYAILYYIIYYFLNLPLTQKIIKFFFSNFQEGETFSYCGPTSSGSDNALWKPGFEGACYNMATCDREDIQKLTALQSGTGSKSGSGVRRKFIIFYAFFFLRSSRKCLSSFFFFFSFLSRTKSGSASGSGSSGSSSGRPGCTADDTTAMTTCSKKLTDEMMKTPPTKDTVCKYYQDVFACYPACYCDDAAFSDAIAAAEKAGQDAIKAMDGGDCTIKCGGAGSGSGSASGSGSSGSNTGLPGCTTDEVTMTDVTDCTSAITDEMTKTPPTKDTICKTYQDIYACYPSCFCDDAANKDMIEDSLKQVDDHIKAMDGGECAIKCGSGTGSGSGSGSGSSSSSSGTGSGSSSGSGEPTMCSIMASMSSDPDKCQGPCMGGASKFAICELVFWFLCSFL